MKRTVKELAEFLGGRVIGDGTRIIEDVKGLAEAEAGDITFAVDPYTEYLPKIHAGAVIVEKEVPAGDNTLILVDTPRLSFSKLLELFHPRQSVEKGVHATAVIDKTAVLGDNTAVMAYAVIGKEVYIGANSVIYPYVFIGDRVRIDEGAVIYPGVVIFENTVIGKNAVIRSHAVIGGEGFGFATKDGVHTRIPQIGNVVIGDDVEIGAGTAIDNGTLGSTKVGRGTKIDNLVHLGHNVEIGEDCFVIAQTGIATVRRRGITLPLRDRPAAPVILQSVTTLLLRASPASSVTYPAIRLTPAFRRNRIWNGAAHKCICGVCPIWPRR